MSDEQWQVSVNLLPRVAICVARKDGRKYKLAYFYNKKRFSFSFKSVGLGLPSEQVPPDADEIKHACLVAMAVARMTK